jgi:hypothetical protein
MFATALILSLISNLATTYRARHQYKIIFSTKAAWYYVLVQALSFYLLYLMFAHQWFIIISVMSSISIIVESYNIILNER